VNRFFQRLKKEYEARRPKIEGPIFQDGMGREFDMSAVLLFCFNGRQIPVYQEAREWNIYGGEYRIDVASIGRWIPEVYDHETRCVSGGYMQQEWYTVAGKCGEPNQQLWKIADSVHELYN